MAAVHENQRKRRRKKRQTDGRRSKLKICTSCEKESKWLSVDGRCWECTVEMAKGKIPLHIDPTEEEQGNISMLPGITGILI